MLTLHSGAAAPKFFVNPQKIPVENVPRGTV